MARKCLRKSHICNFGAEETSLALKKVKKTENTTLSLILLKNNKTLITLNESKCDASSAAPKLSQTINFGPQTGINVSSCLILQKRLSLVLTCPKKSGR